MTTSRPVAVVTGGAGFLGSHLCERLLDDDYDVLCLDNFCTGTPANVAHLVERDGFRLVRADVTDFIHVVGPVDAVLHFASPASPIDYLQLPIATYGDPLIHPQPETYWGNVNPVGPRGVYDEAKRFAEAMTMAYRRTHGV